MNRFRDGWSSVPKRRYSLQSPLDEALGSDTNRIRETASRTS